jgi:hypothetical protein
MIQFFSILFIIISFLLSGCAASPEPVSIPVPFAGSLSSESRLFVEDGLPTEFAASAQISSSLVSLGSAQTLIAPEVGIRWVLMDSKGEPCGSLFFDISTVSPTIKNEDGSLSFQIVSSLDTCHGVVTAQMEFTAFPVPETPTINPVEDCHGEPGSEAVVVNGEAHGMITAGDGDFKNAVEGILDYSFLHEVVMHTNGAVTFCKNDHCRWDVQFP